MWYKEDNSGDDQEFFHDSKGKLYLDKFGFPEMAVADLILLELENYGESREDIEDSWEKWIAVMPRTQRPLFPGDQLAIVSRLAKLSGFAPSWKGVATSTKVSG